MAPRKKKSEDAPVFDLSQYREQRRYVWREIEREDGPPLRVRIEDLSIRQTNDVPWGMDVSLKASMEAVAPYVVEWSLTAENLATGEIVAVPPPCSEAGWRVFELLPNSVAADIINWLKIPHYMKAEEIKKSQAASSSTTEPSSETD